MSTIQQDMTDAAVTLEHLAKRMANELGDGSEEAWNQATQIHAAATILHGWVDERKERLRAAVDEDAPKKCMHSDCGWCMHAAGPSDGCTGWGDCLLFTESVRLWQART